MNQANAVSIERLSITSQAGSGQLWADLYRPAAEPAFSLLIVHGMAEHRARYREFASWMAEQGGFVLVYDQAGHGESAASLDELGFFAERFGDSLVLQDLDEMCRHLISLEPGLPLILFGHSMGSLIVRDYLRGEIPAIQGVILTGTSGPNSALPLGRFLAQVFYRLQGPRSRPALLDKLLHAGFLSRVPQPVSEFDWISRDPAIVADYVQDAYCGYRFTTAALLDLMAWTDRVSQPGWAESLPADLPILLASGEDDPVGQYGRGVSWVEQNLRQAGRLVEARLYPAGRHEILNETNREQVFRDLHEWIYQTMLK